jgi:tripartite-type tricarboxylate transporter receptor subunit TctC
VKRRSILVGGSTLLLCARRAVHAAEKFPSKAITLVVPGSPGGTTDFSGRLISVGLGQALGQTVIVDNKAGANGTIAAQQVLRSAPDGHTLLVAYSGYQAGSPHLVKKLGWDPIKDFAPVAMLTRAPQLVAARRELPVSNLKELVALAKANPGKLNYGSSGIGSIQHISSELFAQTAGITMTHIPYKGAAPAVQDLLAGSIDLVITTPASLVSHIQADKVKALAVASTERLPLLPNVPTAAEAGMPGYVFDSWFALYAPAGTPPEVVQQLNSAVNTLLQSAEVVKVAGAAGTSLESMTPRQLADYTSSELKRWGKVIKDAGIVAE